MDSYCYLLRDRNQLNNQKVFDTAETLNNEFY